MSVSFREIDWRLTLAVVGTAGIGAMGANSMPIWLGAAIDGLGIDNQLGGLLGTFELIASAVGSLWIVSRTGTGSLRQSALLASVAAAGAYGASAASTSYFSLSLARVAAGACCGIVSACGSAAIAAVRDPDRVFALVALIGGLIAAAALVVLSDATDSGGYRGAFGFLGALCLLALPLMLWLPSIPAPPDDSALAARRFTPRVAATLAAIFALSISGQGVWAFSERIAVDIGLTLEETGIVIATSTLAGLLGSVVAAVFGTRFGRNVPIAIGLAASGLTQFGVVHAGTHAMYFAMQIGWGLAFFYLTPYLLGLTAALDRQGRWTASAGAASMIGAAFGPAAAGTSFEWGGRDSFAGFVVVCSLSAATLLLIAARREARGLS